METKRCKVADIPGIMDPLACKGCGCDYSHKWPKDDKLNEYGLAARKALDPDELDCGCVYQEMEITCETCNYRPQWPVYDEAKGG